MTIIEKVEHKKIVTLYKRGLPLREIGDKYGVSGEGIRKILIEYDYRQIQKERKNNLINFHLREYLVFCKEHGRIPTMVESRVFKSKYNCNPQIIKKLKKMGYKRKNKLVREKFIDTGVRLTKLLQRLPTAFELQKIYDVKYYSEFPNIKSFHTVIKNKLSK